MRTMIAVPCMDMVHTLFMTSLLNMRKPEDSEVAVSSSSLVYDARHVLAAKAINEGFDRILWLDSDMHFGPDLMERFSADMDQGLEFVCGLYFTRRNPVKPCVYEVCHDVINKHGEAIPTATAFREIPEGLFEIEACGFAAVMMTTDLIKRVGRFPFYPQDRYGEDFSFCRRARSTGAKLYCDPTIKVDHVGISLINEVTWEDAKRR